MEIGEISSRHKVGLISKVESCIEDLHIAQSFANVSWELPRMEVCGGVCFNHE